jgi:hypothetical protein
MTACAIQDCGDREGFAPPADIRRSQPCEFERESMRDDESRGICLFPWPFHSIIQPATTASIRTIVDTSMNLVASSCL